MIELTSVNQKYCDTQILWSLNMKKGSRICTQVTDRAVELLSDQEQV
ncbi:MAG: hypothetical protein V5786_08590 [Psychromonas sp.]